MGSTRNKNAGQTRNGVETLEFDVVDAIHKISTVEIDKNNDEFDGCLATEDVKEILGKNIDNVRKIIKKCIEAGMCEFAGKRSDRAIDGRVTKTPVYRFKSTDSKIKNKRK